MSTPQPQPIYPRDLSLAIDRSYSHYVGYVDGKFEGLAAQMRLGFADALTRDEALLKRVEALEATQKVIIDLQRDTINALQALQQTVQTMQQEMRDGFAAQSERSGELAVRLDRLERGTPPPSEDPQTPQ